MEILSLQRTRKWRDDRAASLRPPAPTALCRRESGHRRKSICAKCRGSSGSGGREPTLEHVTWRFGSRSKNAHATAG
eukprot:1412027-Pyramimonas_sp.AAC.1